MVEWNIKFQNYMYKIRYKKINANGHTRHTCTCNTEFCVCYEQCFIYLFLCDWPRDYTITNKRFWMYQKLIHFLLSYFSKHFHDNLPHVLVQELTLECNIWSSIRNWWSHITPSSQINRKTCSLPVSDNVKEIVCRTTQEN
jgi:hypothetical protein